MLWNTVFFPLLTTRSSPSTGRLTFGSGTVDTRDAGRRDLGGSQRAACGCLNASATYSGAHGKPQDPKEH
jgi:hypothetical protein